MVLKAPLWVSLTHGESTNYMSGKSYCIHMTLSSYQSCFAYNLLATASGFSSQDTICKGPLEELMKRNFLLLQRFLWCLHHSQAESLDFSSVQFQIGHCPHLILEFSWEAPYLSALLTAVPTPKWAFHIAFQVALYLSYPGILKFWSSSDLQCCICFLPSN